MYSCFESVWEGYSLFSVLCSLFYLECQITWPKKILITLKSSTCLYVPLVSCVEWGLVVLQFLVCWLIGFNSNLKSFGAASRMLL